MFGRVRRRGAAAPSRHDGRPQRLVGVLGDGPDFSHVFLPKGSCKIVDDPAAKAREALSCRDHKRADDERETAGSLDAKLDAVIEEPADVLGFLLGDVFPADVGWCFEIDVIGREAGFFVGFEFHGFGWGWAGIGLEPAGKGGLVMNTCCCLLDMAGAGREKRNVMQPVFSQAAELQRIRDAPLPQSQ